MDAAIIYGQETKIGIYMNNDELNQLLEFNAKAIINSIAKALKNKETTATLSCLDEISGSMLFINKVLFTYMVQDSRNRSTSIYCQKLLRETLEKVEEFIQKSKDPEVHSWQCTKMARPSKSILNMMESLKW